MPRQKSKGNAAANSQGLVHLHVEFADDGDDSNKKFARELQAHVEKAGTFNPLLHGMKNVGRNIGVEVAAGKPRKQATAIAYKVARGKKDYH
jgi:hypothetical protein